MKKNNVLGVILARGGSKGIPQKNIFNICGHPLIAYSIYAGKRSKYLNKIIVSTDNKKISNIANFYGAETPFMRPKKLALDKVWSRDALKHAVLEAEKFYKTKYDIIVEIPAVAPLRPSHQIDRAIKKLIKTKSDSVIGVTRVYDKHPMRIKKIKNDLISDYNETLKEGESSRRQDLPACYVRNGSIYAMTRETIVNKFSRKGIISRPLIMEEKYSINIDESSDLYLAEAMIKKGLCENFPAKLDYNKNILIKNKDNKYYILISYPREICEQIFNDFFKKYNLIYCDLENIHNIKKKIKNKVKVWISNTSGQIMIKKKHIDSFKKLQVLASPSTGITHIDSHYLRKKNIKLIYLQNSEKIKNIKSSSEFTLALILSTIRNINMGQQSVKNGNWRNKEQNLRSNEISSINFGIFGLGRIGSNLYNYLSKMGAKIRYFDPHKNKKGKNLFKEDSINTFLKKTNFLIISAALNNKTRNFFTFDKLKKLPRGSSIINISRGELVNESAILKLLKSKHIKKVSTDVLKNEEGILSKRNKLVDYARNNANLLITPHMAGLTIESEKKALTKISNLLKRTL